MTKFVFDYSNATVASNANNSGYNVMLGGGSVPNKVEVVMTGGSVACTGCLISNITKYGVNTPVNSAESCNAVTQLIQNNSCNYSVCGLKSSKCCLANGIKSTDDRGDVSIIGSTNTTISSIYANYLNSICNVIITDGDCNKVSSSIYDDSCGNGLAVNSCGSNCGYSSKFYLLNGEGVPFGDRNAVCYDNVSVTSSSIADRVIPAVPPTPPITAINITCGTAQNSHVIPYTFTNSTPSFDPLTKQLEFTPLDNADLGCQYSSGTNYMAFACSLDNLSVNAVQYKCGL